MAKTESNPRFKHLAERTKKITAETLSVVQPVREIKIFSTSEPRLTNPEWRENFKRRTGSSWA